MANISKAVSSPGAVPSRSISNMLADIRYRGLAKTNRFAMLIPAPIGMPEIEGFNSDHWSKFSIETTQIPGFTVLTQENSTYHFTQKMPYMIMFDEIQMSIRCDGWYSERKFFEEWRKLMRNPHSGNMRYKRDYTVDLFIEQLDDNGNVIFGVIIMNAYPVQLGDLDLQSQNVDFHHMNVSFAYDRYVTYDDMDWNRVFESIHVEGGEDYKRFMENKFHLPLYPDGQKDYERYMDEQSIEYKPAIPAGQAEYQAYQNRGNSPMQLLRHVANGSNYAKSKLRDIITGAIPSI